MYDVYRIILPKIITYLLPIQSPPLQTTTYGRSGPLSCWRRFVLSEFLDNVTAPKADNTACSSRVESNVE
jgi:hypothetical protein